MAGQIRMKFGTEVVLEGGKVLGGVSTRYPHPPGTGCVKGVRGASGASTVRFGENFIKQKLQGAPDFWAPNPGPEGPGPPVLLEPWSLTMKDSL